MKRNLSLRLTKTLKNMVTKNSLSSAVQRNAQAADALDEVVKEMLKQ